MTLVGGCSVFWQTTPASKDVRCISASPSSDSATPSPYPLGVFLCAVNTGMRVLVQWSGGVESTALLKTILEETTWQVIAHNVYLQGEHAGKERVRREQRAMQELFPKLHTVRPFAFQQSTMRLLDGDHDLHERSLQWSFTLAAMQALHCDATFRGMCAEDNYPRTWLNGEWRYTDPAPGKTVQARRKDWIESVLTGIAAANRTELNAQKLAPWHHTYAWPKAKHWQALGELQPLTWSCRRPNKDGSPCEQCHSCTELNAAKTGTSAVKQVADKMPQTQEQEQ